MPIYENKLVNLYFWKMKMKKIAISFLTLLLSATSINAKNTKYLVPEVALHYFKQGKVLSCISYTKDNKKDIIVTNNFISMYIQDRIVFTNNDSNNFKFVTADYCNLYHKE